MTIPPSFTRDVLSLHRLVTREYIFKYARFDVVSSWHAVGSRRAFIKCPWSSAGTRFSALMEDVIVAPEIEDRTFHRWKVDSRWNRAER